MDAVRHCVLSCLPAPAVTRAGTLSAADDNDGEDRISALPDELLRDVVSRLPIKDAARTAVLSPRWRRVWRSTPLVLYDAHLFPSSSEDARVAAIHRILAGHPCPLRTVHLDLVFISQPPPVDMPLPVDILRCTELRRLYLGFFHFPDTRDLPNGAGVFPHLREFVVLNTCMEDRDLDHMLASSPELETLAFVVSYGMPELVRLLGKKLKCVLFWLSMAEELAVVDAPSLERLIMWHTHPPQFDESDDEPRMRVKIACAPELKVLGYLELGAHKLQIEHTVIKSVIADKSTGEHYAEFFEKLSPIQCVRNNIKKVVLYKFHMDISEVAFLKFMTQRADELQKLTLVLPDEALVQVSQDLLGALAIPPWASKECVVLLVGPIVERGWDFYRASDLSIDDPFLLEHEQELFCLVKKGE
ncbi:unnamed protein product [Urochloa decumbens]|uniref:F-box domain-containing protein n=1 Tax=Urochloa decumbens TaxID=240449 RepID=A0ABC8Z6E4_9POAL